MSTHCHSIQRSLISVFVCLLPVASVLFSDSTTELVFTSLCLSFASLCFLSLPVSPPYCFSLEVFRSQNWRHFVAPSIPLSSHPIPNPSVNLVFETNRWSCMSNVSSMPSGQCRSSRATHKLTIEEGAGRRSREAIQVTLLDRKSEDEGAHIRTNTLVLRWCTDQ